MRKLFSVSVNNFEKKNRSFQVHDFSCLCLDANFLISLELYVQFHLNDNNRPTK